MKGASYEAVLKPVPQLIIPGHHGPVQDEVIVQRVDSAEPLEELVSGRKSFDHIRVIRVVLSYRLDQCVTDSLVRLFSPIFGDV